MKIDEKKKEGLDLDWLVTIPAKIVTEKLDSEYFKISANVNLPGFRPGKVPLNIIKQKYSKSVIPKILDEIINNSLKKAVLEKKIQPAVQPKVEIKSFDEGNDLIFQASFQKMPMIPEKDIKKLQIEKSELKINNDDINRTLKEVASNHERFKPLEKKRKAKFGDLILFDYEGKIKGKVFEGGKGKDETVVLGSNKYIPGYEDQMVGLEVNEKKKINVTFPVDYRQTNLAGKNATFDLDIKDIQARVKNIPVDEKLATEMGEKSLDDLKKKIKDKMMLDFEKFASLKMRRELTDKMLQEYNFDIPSRMIEDEEKYLKQQNDQQKEKKDDKEIKKLSLRRVKLGLIINNLGKANSIEINDKDLTKSIAAEAQKYPGDEKRVVDFYKKNPQMIENLRGIAFEEKVMNFLINSCSKKVKECTFDELFNSDKLQPEKKIVKAQSEEQNMKNVKGEKDE